MTHDNTEQLPMCNCKEFSKGDWDAWCEICGMSPEVLEKALKSSIGLPEQLPDVIWVSTVEQLLKDAQKTVRPHVEKLREAEKFSFHPDQQAALQPTPASAMDVNAKMLGALEDKLAAQIERDYPINHVAVTTGMLIGVRSALTPTEQPAGAVLQSASAMDGEIPGLAEAISEAQKTVDTNIQMYGEYKDENGVSGLCCPAFYTETLSLLIKAARRYAALQPVAPDNRPDNTGLDDGPPLSKSQKMAWKKPLILKAWQLGVSGRTIAKIFDVSHETVYSAMAGVARNKPQPVAAPDGVITGAMQGAGVATFLHHVSKCENIQDACDNADPIILEVYSEMLAAAGKV